MDLDWHKKQLKDLENLLGPKKNEIDDLNEKLKLHGMHQAFEAQFGCGVVPIRWRSGRETELYIKKLEDENRELKRQLALNILSYKSF